MQKENRKMKRVATSLIILSLLTGGCASKMAVDPALEAERLASEKAQKQATRECHDLARQGVAEKLAIDPSHTRTIYSYRVYREKLFVLEPDTMKLPDDLRIRLQREVRETAECEYSTLYSEHFNSCITDEEQEIEGKEPTLIEILQSQPTANLEPSLQNIWADNR